MKPCPRLWVVSELYFPEQTSTGHYLTRIAEGLAPSLPTNVLCSQPTYSSRGLRAPVREIRNGVNIRRVPGTTLDKNVLPFRLLNALTITISMWAVAVACFRSGDAVLVVTNPPFLPFAIRLACALRGASCVLLVHDVYPEVLTVTGHVRARGLRYRLLAALARRLYRSMKRIVVIGSDMERRVRARIGDAPPVVLIPNWADLEEVRPLARRDSTVLRALGLTERFVIQYSGNMGRSHGLGILIDAAAALAADPSVHFLLIGSGARRAWVEQQVAERGLTNVTVHGSFPREQLAEALGACDLAIISLEAGMAGISVPSRMYNILASGRPLIAVADRDSDLATIVDRHQTGWVVAPGDVMGLVGAIEQARRDPADLAERGARARSAAEMYCRYADVMQAYTHLFKRLMARTSPEVDRA